jgi:hypothetical protein
LADAISKRPWLKRGIAATESYATADECPESERPFYVFFDSIHREILRRLLEEAGARSSTWTAFHTLVGADAPVGVRQVRERPWRRHDGDPDRTAATRCRLS